MYVPDTALDSMFTRHVYTGSPLEVYFLADVKDDAAADAFLKEVIKTGPKLTSKDDTLAGVPATLFLDDKNVPVLARWKGYIALGTPSMAHFLDSLNTKKATLD